MRNMRGLIAAAAAMSAGAVGDALDPRPRAPAPTIRPVYRKSAKLNRSRHWPYAENYEEARAMSPSSRPVR